MNIEVVLGAIILAAWAALLLWRLGQTALSARKGYTSSDYIIGLVSDPRPQGSVPTTGSPRHVSGLRLLNRFARWCAFSQLAPRYL